mgnify:CR=1 FL=1
MNIPTSVDPYLDRTSAAEDIRTNYFPTTPRALREWDLPTVTIGGRACARRSEWRAEAERRLNGAQFDGRGERRAKTSRARQVLAASRAGCAA